MWNAQGDPPNPAEKFDPRKCKPAASYCVYIGRPLPSSDSLIPNPMAPFGFQYREPFSPWIEQKEASAPWSSEMAEEQKVASAPSSSEMAEDKESKYLFYWHDDPNNNNPFPVSGGQLDPPPKKWSPISLNVPTIPDPKNPYPKPPVTDHFTCEICGGAHFRSFCSYWIRIPENPHIIFDTTSPYQIVCECSFPVVDGACSRGCPPNGPTRIAEKYLPVCPTRSDSHAPSYGYGL